MFAYDTGALEPLAWCKEHGIKTVLGQMDPNRVEVDLVREEGLRWPHWQHRPIEVPEAYFRRREREWAVADKILVNSEFCRQALLQQGVPAEKLFVVPLCYEAESGGWKVENGRWKTEEGRRKMEARSGGIRCPNSHLSSSISDSPLRVLFLGQVILRKGIQYLVEAARLMPPARVRFDVVGPIGVSAMAIQPAPPNVIFHGRVSRDQAAAWYRQADVFVLPTISDGFAITQLEAMANGLPVVATPCCGEVVTDTVDGFVVPARDPQALATTFQRYLDDAKLLLRQREAAFAKSSQFTLERLGKNLCKLEAELSGTRAQA
jgi:glycosyltransferase involved in cell wall biosynthesis